MKEFEFKTLINKIKYDEISNFFYTRDINARMVINENYYYDVDGNLLFRKSITLRVRKINEKLLLQIKTPVSVSEFLVVNNEYVEPLVVLPGCIELKKYKALEPFNISGIANLKGKLITKRYCYCLQDSIKVFLDKNYYLQQKDYDLEVEYTGDNKKTAYSIFSSLAGSELGIPTPGKKSRFFRYLEGIEKGK